MGFAPTTSLGNTDIGGVMPRKLPETLTEEEFIEVIKKTNQQHHKLAFSLAFYEGMRISECLNLNKDNIDFNQRLIRIKEGKGKKDRNIPILPEFYSSLKKSMELLPIKCGERSLQIAFKKALLRAGISRNLHFHNLRHSCATWLLNKKRWDVRHVQQYLGHSRLDTTQIYTIVSPQTLLDLAWNPNKIQ